MTEILDMNTATRQNLDMQTRMRLLEDAEEIRWMKAYYAQVCDGKFTSDHKLRPQDAIDAAVGPMVERVFAEDASWEGSPSGGPAVVGREAIFQRLRSNFWTFAMHYYVNPLIGIEGDTAHARWMLWEPCTDLETGKALWMSAVTEDDYVRTAEGWRIKRYVVHYKFLTPFDRPWTDRP
jgi:hypothetical protein